MTDPDDSFASNDARRVLADAVARYDHAQPATPLQPTGGDASPIDLVRAANTPDSQLADLVGHADLRVAIEAVAHPNAGPSVFAAVATDTRTAVRRAAAAGCDLASHEARELTDQLTGDTDDDTRRALAGNPTCPGYVLVALADGASDRVLYALAGNPCYPRLSSLARHPHPVIRERLAANNACSRSVLGGLAFDTDARVVGAVVANERISTEDLVGIAEIAPRPVLCNAMLAHRALDDTQLARLIDASGESAARQRALAIGRARLHADLVATSA